MSHRLSVLLCLGCLWPPLFAEDQDWRAQAEERIAANRTVTTTLDLTGPDGAALPAGTAVQVRMTRHSFLFGTALSRGAFTTTGVEPGNDRYLAEVAELFNGVVMENAHKWGKWLDPEERARAEQAVRWATGQGLRVRGHTMVWGVTKYKSVIPAQWRKRLGKLDEAGRTELRETLLAHIADIGGALPMVEGWDVVNEPLHEKALFRALGAGGKEAQVALMTEWFHAARRAAPDARLALNDFGVITGDDRYFRFAQALVAAGAPIDVIGFQGHHWNAGQRRRAAQLYAEFDRYAELGLQVAITEWDTTWGKGAAAFEQQGAYFEKVLMTLYSHPAGCAFLVWGFWDGRHWRNNAAFYHEDWRPKPALAVWRRLVLDEWRTDAAGQVDADGTVTVTAHFGEHEVLAEVGDRRLRGVITLDADTATAAVQLGEFAAGSD